MENSGERVGIIKKPEMYFLQRTKDNLFFISANLQNHLQKRSVRSQRERNQRHFQNLRNLEGSSPAQKSDRLPPWFRLCRISFEGRSQESIRGFVPQHARLRTSVGVGVGGGGGHGRDLAEEDGASLCRRWTAAVKAFQKIGFFGIARCNRGRNVKPSTLNLSLIKKITKKKPFFLCSSAILILELELCGK